MLSGASVAALAFIGVLALSAPVLAQSVGDNPAGGTGGVLQFPCGNCQPGAGGTFGNPGNPAPNGFSGGGGGGAGAGAGGSGGAPAL